MNHKKNILVGTLFGLFMFLMVAIVFPLLQSETLSPQKLVKQVIFWIIAGIIYEYITPYVLRLFTKTPKE